MGCVGFVWLAEQMLIYQETTLEIKLGGNKPLHSNDIDRIIHTFKIEIGSLPITVNMLNSIISIDSSEKKIIFKYTPENTGDHKFIIYLKDLEGAQINKYGEQINQNPLDITIVNAKIYNFPIIHNTVPNNNITVLQY